MLSYQIYQADNVFSDEYLKAIAASGFKAVDLNLAHSEKWAGEGVNSAKDSEYYAKLIRSRLDGFGLSCVQVHLPFGDLLLSSEIDEPKRSELTKTALSVMPVLGCKWGAYHPRSSTGFGYDKKRALDDNIREISGYLETAKSFGTGIAIENLPVFAGAPQWKFYCSDYRDLLELYEGLGGGPNLGICWDFGHANLTQTLLGLDNSKALRAVGERLKITHVHGNYGKDDSHSKPLDGNIDWKTQISLLKEIGYLKEIKCPSESKDKREGNLSLETNEPTEALPDFISSCFEQTSEIEKL